MFVYRIVHMYDVFSFTFFHVLGFLGCYYALCLYCANKDIIIMIYSSYNGCHLINCSCFVVAELSLQATHPLSCAVPAEMTTADHNHTRT